VCGIYLFTNLRYLGYGSYIFGQLIFFQLQTYYKTRLWKKRVVCMILSMNLSLDSHVHCAWSC